MSENWTKEGMKNLFTVILHGEAHDVKDEVLSVDCSLVGVRVDENGEINLIWTEHGTGDEYIVDFGNLESFTMFWNNYLDEWDSDVIHAAFLERETQIRSIHDILDCVLEEGGEAIHGTFNAKDGILIEQTGH